MSSAITSQNRFAYFGNDEDGDAKPNAPVKTVDKASTHTTKRNVEPQAPVRAAGATGNRRGGPGGNEGAFRDRNAGSSRNQARSTDEAPREGARGGAGARGRGGRGGRRPREQDDRHSRQNRDTTAKQTAQGWGANEGNAELKDEQAAEAIAEGDKNAAADAEVEPAEPEDKSVSYSDYLAQQAEKKLALGGHKVREANEGSKLDKKWAGAKALENDEEEYVTAAGGKKLRERERKVKQTIDFDPRFVESERPRGGARGGARGERGGRGGARGGDRGGARGGDRGGDRGGRGGERGARGGARGGRPPAANINTKDEAAFPSLGK
ncbi:hypothetical protein MY10362_002632 [Beauveria mimosiformis]